MVTDGEFKFEKCLNKHFVRRHGWLPACKERAEIIQDSANKNRPRLKYFTFCAPGALDVVMLNLEKVVRASAGGNFDTVYYFGFSEAQVVQTRESIPGAIGFPGDFVNVVLEDDPAESQMTDAVSSLEPPEDDEDTRKTRKQLQLRTVRRQFIKSFPFDVVNFDLERYLFRPKEALPGKLVAAFRKAFEWQRMKGTSKGGKSYSIDGFELMFTVRVGPDELSQEYLDMMLEYVQHNIAENQELQPIFEARFNRATVDDLLKNDFASFFKLAVPKTILGILKDEDWHVDSSKGIKVFEFDRPDSENPYTMLHLVMSVKRNSPPKESRGPGMTPPAIVQAYRNGVEAIFSTDTIKVERELKKVGKKNTNSHLDKVFKHRDKIGTK